MTNGHIADKYGWRRFRSYLTLTHGTPYGIFRFLSCQYRPTTDTVTNRAIQTVLFTLETAAGGSSEESFYTVNALIYFLQHRSVRSYFQMNINPTSEIHCLISEHSGESFDRFSPSSSSSITRDRMRIKGNIRNQRIASRAIASPSRTADYSPCLTLIHQRSPTHADTHNRICFSSASKATSDDSGMRI